MNALMRPHSLSAHCKMTISFVHCQKTTRSVRAPCGYRSELRAAMEPQAKLHQRRADRRTMRMARNSGGTLLACFVVLLLLGGCQSGPAPFDPFLAGRNTIAPPATAIPAGAPPYYSATPPTVTVPVPAPAPAAAIYTSPGATPAVAVPANVPANADVHFPRGTSLPQSNNQTPNSGLQWAATDAPRSSTTMATAAEQPADAGRIVAASNMRSANSSSTQARPTTGEVKAGVVQASYDEASSGPAAIAAQVKSAPLQAVPVNHEPPIRIVEPAQAAPPQDAPRSAPVQAAALQIPQPETRPASNETPSEKLPELTDFPPVGDRVTRSTPGYGHEPSYAWLTGKLEYSPSRQQWKLRYIALESATDAYGGSVVLPESEKLKSFRAGDFVRVDGRVLQKPEDSKEFAPTYSIDRIQKQ
jgi:hypothetical protein